MAITYQLWLNIVSRDKYATSIAEMRIYDGSFSGDVTLITLTARCTILAWVNFKFESHFGLLLKPLLNIPCSLVFVPIKSAHEKS